MSIAAGVSAAPDTSTALVPNIPLVDPTNKFPKPPFPEQKQPWPGLACKMQPRPDHGESSYKGSGRLKGRRALITGGDSGMPGELAGIYVLLADDQASFATGQIYGSSGGAGQP
jgi:hypothetical protein